MFKIKVKLEVKNYCIKLLEQHNFGQRGFADGNYEEQLTGLIGQCSIEDALGLPLVDGEGGFDEGKDIVINEKVIDIKTMGRTTDVRGYYVNNFIGLQKNYKTDVYIFCSFNKKKGELTVCGWATKNELLKRAKFYKQGTKRFRSDGSYFRTKADLYEIANSELNKTSSIDDLEAAIAES